MKVPTAIEFRKRALMLLKIERIQFNEQMVLLGYKDEKAGPAAHVRLTKKERLSFLADTTMPASLLVH
jgi:hypothetical protein